MAFVKLWITLGVALLSLAGCAGMGQSSKSSQPKGLMYMSVAEMFPGKPQAQALALAAGRGDIGEIDRLVAAGADVNAVGTYGVAITEWLFHHPSKAGFRRLLEHGADPNKIWFIQYAGTKEQISLLHRAVEDAPYIGTDYLRMCLEIGRGDPNLLPPDKRYRPIQKALRFGNEDAFMILVKAGAEIDYKDESGRPLVFYAASYDNFEITLYLLEQGVDYSSNYTGGGIKDIRESINIDLGRHNLARDNTVPHYMWFWRCVDFLEKRGMVFNYTPKGNRPPAVKPAVLDTTPPLSKSTVQRMSLTDSVLMHEVHLTYPIPFWAQTPETKFDVLGRQTQTNGKISYEYLPTGQTLDDWKAILTVSAVYAPGVSFRDFVKMAAKQSGFEDIQTIEESSDHSIRKVSARQGQPVEGIQYLGKFENTFVVVWQAWRSVDTATARDYQATALAGAKRIVMKKGMNVFPLD
ncbi:ankyrin repeat domain-containing protein [Desulfomicrobium sp. ZS1]|uniref:ankyrin repeat domain-containing protein n=1 Tax=Desulfomicrobium sp. ZS1 TaxID=2952228 RepID=UPI0020B39269|nr:ankyrin repeat domain-containing protein [Desulfomicrobium sp. ZS1]UTF51700.1 ankyrin repeat domain-containing protein [Desulfomicrobium sp. ZS1]